MKRIFKTKKITGCSKMTEDILKVKFEQCAEEEAENDFEDFGYRKPQIFIDQLLRMRGVFSREEIRDEVNTIITAVRIYIDHKLIKNLIYSAFRDTKQQHLQFHQHFSCWQCTKMSKTK